MRLHHHSLLITRYSSFYSSGPIAFGDAEYFVYAGDSFDYFFKTGLAERDHPLLDSKFADPPGIDLLDTQLANGVARLQQLEDSRSAGISGLPAIFELVKTLG